MSRETPRSRGQTRQHSGPPRGGPAGRRGGVRGSQVEDLSRRMESLGGFAADEEGNQTIHIATNHFPIHCHSEPKEGSKAEPREFTVHQFRIEFSDKEMTVPLKKALLGACQAEVFRGAYLYDGGEQLYCTNKFTDGEVHLYPEFEKTEAVAPLQPEKTKLTITFAKTLTQSDKVSFQIYNLILRQCMFGIGLDPLGENFYDSSAVIDYPNLKIQLWPGYVCNVKPCEAGLLLCVDVIHKVVHSDDLLSFIKSLMRTYEKKRDPNLSRDEFILGELKGYMVITPYNKLSYRIDGIKEGMTPMSTFQLKNGERISFFEYYKKKYNVEIIDKNQPLIFSNVKRRFKGQKLIEEVILIPELCSLTGLSDEMRNNFNIMRELGTHLHLKPAERMEMIQNFMQKLSESKPVRLTLAKWGLSFDSKPLPCIPGKVMAHEEMVFMNKRSFRADDKNDWTKGIRENKMLVSIPLKEWIVIVGERDGKLTRDFVETMKKVGGPLGFQINQPTMFETLKDTRTVNYIHRLEDLVLSNKGKYQMALCVLPTNAQELYNAVKKRLTKDIGLVSQCIVAKTMTKNMMSVATKVVIQINAKLGGEPWKVNIPPQFRQSTMTIGFDYTGKGVRTGVLVATINQDCTRYYSLCFQFKEQSLLNERLKDGLHTILKAYINDGKRDPPTQIVFYRNNVDDGRITSGEVDADAKTMLCALEERSKTFKTGYINLVYITVAKGSTARLMSHMGECTDKQAVLPSQLVNPPPGTAVNTQIVSSDKRHSEFFLVPTVARQGTVRAVHYRIILDTTGLNASIIEAFTYKLCHLYFNWSGTVNLPSVIQYASKLAKQATQTIPSGQPHREMATLLHFL